MGESGVGVVERDTPAIQLHHAYTEGISANFDKQEVPARKKA